MKNFLNEKLNALQASGLYRELKTIEKVHGPHIFINGKKYINFCSNNYLGLADHPKVIEAAIEAMKEFGFGAGASRLVSGNTVLHEQLEKKIAAFKGREAALVFPTGYQTNLGTITALTDEKDTIIIDRLNHASIIDACHLSKAKLQVYPHKDMVALEKVLARSTTYQKRLIITDSVFSMDGDIAPLPEIVKLAKQYDALTMIDEAHATGVLGSSGKGLEEYFGITGQVDIVMGTLSKALGSLGGFIAGSAELIDFLKNKARSFIYTTALPPAACAAALAALEIIESEPGWLRSLRINSRLLSERTETPIIPVLVGEAEQTMAISTKFFERGILLSGIRPPTVPDGESRLRITVMATHTKEDLACLASSLRELIPASAKPM